VVQTRWPRTAAAGVVVLVLIVVMLLLLLLQLLLLVLLMLLLLLLMVLLLEMGLCLVGGLHAVLNAIGSLSKQRASINRAVIKEKS